MSDVKSQFGSNRAARRSRPRGRVIGASGALMVGGTGALLAAFAGSASASATINVDSASDGVPDATHCTDGVAGNCTFRDAASAAADGDTITFDAAVTSITLTGGTVVLDAVNLIGSGSANLTFSTAGAPGAYNLFEFQGTGDVLISGMSLTKNRIEAQNVGDLKLDDVSISGSSGGYGGALYAGNDGDLEIIDSDFDDNSGASNGGAVYAYNSGSVTISNSSFTNNAAAGDAGAVFTSTNVTGSISITDSNFAGNYAGSSGGALELYGDGTADVTIRFSTFTDNEAHRWGGAFYAMDNVADLTIDGSVFSGNHAVSGSGVAYIDNSGDLTITNTVIENNTSVSGSGGLYVTSGGNATITGSLISGNSAAGGQAGGIANDAGGVLTINNSTLTGNVALYGGAIFNATSLVINQSTIVGNTATYEGGGILTAAGASLSISGGIVSGNSGAVGFADVATNTPNGQTITSNHSLLGEIDSRITVNGSNNISSLTPMVGALADNGGPTRTMALLTGSPAIDAGPDPVATFVGNDSDQRGLPWVRIYGGSADIGAFEVQPDPVGPTTTTTADPNPVVPTFTG